MRKLSPTKNKCSSCQQYIGSDCRYCPHCSTKNVSFEEEKSKLLRTGARSGWQAPPAPGISPEAEATGKESQELRQLDDLMKNLRQRKRKREETGEPAAAAKQTAPAPAEAEQEVPPASPASSDQEWDLDTVEGCTSYLVCLFSKSRRSQARPVADFYVRECLKPQVKKNCPLYRVFTMELKKLDKLKTQARTRWLQTWETKRTQRHAKVNKKK